MNPSDSHDSTENWALITGASMGLGEEFARQLAQRKINLLLTARSGEKLEKIAEDLRGEHGIRAETFTADLAQADGAKKVLEWIRGLGIVPAWLINNAGFGHARSFDKIDEHRLLDCVAVNITALTVLTRALLPAMRQLKEARLINVASTAAFQPVPFFGVYAATKAFVLSLTEALHEEMKETGVKVTCLCPGPTSTNFGANNEIAPRMFHWKQTAEAVVKQGLEGSDRGEAVVVTQNQMTVQIQRLLPRSAVRGIAGWLVRKSLKP